MEITLRSLLCETCGFVTYAPRPTSEEIDAKYRFLARVASDVNNRIDAESVGEQQRAERLWRKCRRHLHRQPCRVLDFGGGDGRLMRPFIQHGHRCFVVDYSTETIRGVRWLASTLDDLPAGERFDLIVCSHVVEHVAEPLQVLSRLRSLLVDSGGIYVEVPMEIWRMAPLHDEPVTHVNFFTVESLRFLLARAGFADLHVRMEGYRHPAGHRSVVVSGFGRHIDGVHADVSNAGAASSTRELLNPRLRTRIQRALLNPRQIPAAAYCRIKNRLSNNGSLM